MPDPKSPQSPGGSTSGGKPNEPKNPFVDPQRPSPGGGSSEPNRPMTPPGTPRPK